MIKECVSPSAKVLNPRAALDQSSSLFAKAKAATFCAAFCLLLSPLHSMTNGLVVHWELEYGALGSDSISGLDLSSEGSFVSSFSGVVNGSGYFDGAAKLRNDSKTGVFNSIFSQQSISFWMRPELNQLKQTVIDAGGLWNGTAIRINDGKIEAALISNGVQHIVSADIDANAWTHVVLVFDGTANGRLELYLNRQSVGMMETGLSTIYAQGDPISLGGIAWYNAFEDSQWDPGSGHQNFEGILDDVRAYDIALDESVIDDLYSLGASELHDLAGVAVHLKMDLNAIAEDAQGEVDMNEYGDLVTSSGVMDEGAYFDGGSYLGVVSGYSHLNAPFSERTVSLWVNPDSLDQHQVIYDEGGATHGCAIRIFDGKLQANFALSSNRTNIVETVIEPGEWSHVVLVFDGTNSGMISLFVNNELRDEISTGWNEIRRHNGKCGVGAINSMDSFNTSAAAGNKYFAGYLDDLRVYGEALSPADVFELYDLAHELAQYNWNIAGKTNVVRLNADRELVVTQLDVSTGEEGESAQLTAIPVGWRYVGGADFDGDGHSDFFIQHEDGQINLLYFEGTRLVLELPVGTSDALAKAVIDRDGDGIADLLLQDESTSHITEWLLDANANYSENVLLGQSTVWELVGAADIDGNGDNDELILQKPDEGVKVWNTVTGTEDALYYGVFPHQIIGVQHLNDDGNWDLLLDDYYHDILLLDGIIAGAAQTAIVPPAPTGVSYYINGQGGSNLNSGLTPEEAWRSVSKINNLDLNPGDTVYIAGNQTYAGPYRIRIDAEDSGTLDQPVVIKSYNGIPTLDSTNLRVIDLVGVSHFKLEGLKLQGQGRDENPLSYGVYISDASHITVDNVEATGFNRHGLGGDGVSHLKVTNSIFDFNGSAGVFVYGGSDNVYFGHCRTNNNLGDPFEFVHHSGSGLMIGDTTDCLIEYCESSNNGGEMPKDYGAGPVGIWTYESNRVAIQYCISYLNDTHPTAGDGGGFDLDGGVRNSFIRYCLAYGNMGGGYYTTQYDAPDPQINNQIYNNISIDHRPSEMFVFTKTVEEGVVVLPVELEISRNLVIRDQDQFNGEGMFDVYNGGNLPEGSTITLDGNIFVTREEFIGQLAPGVQLLNNTYVHVGSGLPKFNNQPMSVEDWAFAANQELVNGEFVGTVNNGLELNIPLMEDLPTDPALLKKSDFEFLNKEEKVSVISLFQ